MSRLTTSQVLTLVNALATYSVFPLSIYRYGRILTGKNNIDPQVGYNPQLRDGEFAYNLSEFSLPILEKYFRVEYRGIENIKKGRALYVGNHNGGLQPVDSVITAGKMIKVLGRDVPVHALMHDYIFKEPSFINLVEKIGGLKASHKAAEKAFDMDSSVLVYPGGDIDTFKPWGKRDEIITGKRKGFIRLVLKNRIPLIPVASCGAHEVWYVLSSGTKLAAALKLKKILRTETFPVVAALPWGITSGFFPYIPAPSKIVIEFSKPIYWNQYFDLWEDDDVVEKCHARFSTTMNNLIQKLHSERKYPVIG
ncbi:MAG: acyltransferase family protein [Deltaproteobacteria bacterium]|nr:acyltransferase family protein [Deltaproteobacteria bacterium]